MFDIGLFLILVLMPLVGIAIASFTLDWLSEKPERSELNELNQW